MYFLSGGTDTETWTQVNGQWPLYLQTDNNNAIFGGRIGVGGVTNPATPIHIGSGNTVVTGIAAYYSYFYFSSTNVVNAYASYGLSTTQNWSLACDSAIITRLSIVSYNGAVTASDHRIKTDIEDVIDDGCLDLLRQLKPKKIKYKDVITKGNTPVWGFIAQDVQDTIPYATEVIEGIIPNIYEMATVSNSNVITFTNFNTSNLEANASTIEVIAANNRHEKITVEEIIDEHTIRVKEDLSEMTHVDNQLFIYGQVVDDFVFLKKGAIWTVTTAALQQVDRKVQTLEARILALETVIANL